MKIGDRVRVIKDSPFVPHAAVGQVGVIVGQDKTFPDLFDVEGPWLRYPHKVSVLAEEELELVEEAQGERTANVV